VTAGIPDKLYFKIGEVSTLTSLPASVLRYWESEFSSLAPKKSSSGQRLYARKDVERVIEIKNLLYAEKLTIEGARKRLEAKKRQQNSEQSSEALTILLQDVRTELQDLRDLL